jgi:hypothetical protein
MEKRSNLSLLHIRPGRQAIPLAHGTTFSVETWDIYITEDTLEHARTLATAALEFSDQSLNL